jgi:hypothetical protein
MGKAGQGGCSTLWELVCGKGKGDDAMRRGVFIFGLIASMMTRAHVTDFSSDPNTSERGERIWLTADSDLCHRLVRLL